MEVVSVLLSAGVSIEVQTKVRRTKDQRVVFISFVFRKERLPFTLLVLTVLWGWSLSCWQQALISKLEIR
jgi:cell division septal protein FtsQ